MLETIAISSLLSDPNVQGMLVNGILSVCKQTISSVSQQRRDQEDKERERRNYEHALAIEHLRASNILERDRNLYAYTLSLLDHQHQQNIDIQYGEHQQQLKVIEKVHDHQKALETLKSGFNQDLESFKLKLSLIGLSHQLSTQRLFETYPDSRGPGRLRAGLDMLPEYRSSRKIIPPMVLIPPFENDGSAIQHHQELGIWREFRSIAQYYLGHYGSRLHVPPAYPDRPFPWPHDAFYIYDLLGIPTIIVKTAVTRHSLSVFIGGCHLTSYDLGNVQALQPALRLRLNPLDNGKIELYQKGITVTENELIELAAKAIHLCVIRLMDVYYLTIERQYDEFFDFALDNEGIQYSKELLTHDLPTQLLIDPAYHQIHQFGRFTRIEDEYRASLELTRAIHWLCLQCKVETNEHTARKTFQKILDRMIDGQNEIPNNIILHLRKLLEVIGLADLSDSYHNLLSKKLKSLENAGKLPFTSQGNLI